MSSSGESYTPDGDLVSAWDDERVVSVTGIGFAPEKKRDLFGPLDEPNSEEQNV